MISFIGLVVAVALADGCQRPGRPSQASLDELWTSTGTVPDKLNQVPDSPLYIRFGDIRVTPNMTLDTSQIQKKPTLKWNADPNALYTLLIEDNDIDNEPPMKYAHWLVTNIPGDDVCNGEEVATWLPSFSFNIGADAQIGQPGVTNRHLVLIYKQKGRIDDISGQTGCNPGLLDAPRIIDHDKLQADYDLEGPVAGNFYRIGYSEGWTQYYACYFTKCMGFPLPMVIPGVNDGAECVAPL